MQKKFLSFCLCLISVNNIYFFTLKFYEFRELDLSSYGLQIAGFTS